MSLRRAKPPLAAPINLMKFFPSCSNAPAHAALAQLTPERRQLVSLAFLHGMSHQEIAHATRLRSAQSRAMYVVR